jgi:transcriptional regulator with XRE-family HTH domain
MAMRAKRAKFTDQLRAIVEGCGKSRYQIAKETGIDESTLSRFVHGERCLSGKALDALGECLGLKVVVEKSPTKKGR